MLYIGVIFNMPTANKTADIDNNTNKRKMVEESKPRRVTRRGRPASKNMKSRRGRPPLKKPAAKPGRPKRSPAKTTATTKDREVRRALRDKIKNLRGEIGTTKLEYKDKLRAVKLEYREIIKNEKELVKSVQKKLKEALKREQALKKLFEMKEKAVSRYADRWTEEQIAKIESPTKRRRRRTKAA